MKAILSFATAAGLAACASAAMAVSAPPVPHAGANAISVRDGCGRGFHEDRRGRCVRDGGWYDGWRHGDGCDRYHHRRWGRCVPNY